MFEQLIPDDTPEFRHIIVEGNHIQIFVNDKKTVDFTDEKNTFTDGYLALQQHNAGSVVEFKNLMIRHLPAPESPLAGTWRLNLFWPMEIRGPRAQARQDIRDPDELRRSAGRLPSGWPMAGLAGRRELLRTRARPGLRS